MAEKKWGDYTKEQGAKYYQKLGIKCCDEACYVQWFVNAERANTRCRTVSAFCRDCRLCFATEMREQGKCINPNFNKFQETIKDSAAKSEQ